MFWRRFCKASWRRFENVLARHLEDVLKTFLLDVFKTSSRCIENLLKTFWRRHEHVWARRIYLSWSRRHEDVLKTSSEDVWVSWMYSSGSRRLQQDGRIFAKNIFAVICFICYFLKASLLYQYGKFGVVFLMNIILFLGREVAGVIDWFVTAIRCIFQISLVWHLWFLLKQLFSI